MSRNGGNGLGIVCEDTCEQDNNQEQNGFLVTSCIFEDVHQFGSIVLGWRRMS